MNGSAVPGRIPRLELSLIWFFCMAGMGFIFPFYSLYLRANVGLSGTQVGAVLAMLPLVAVATQALWGQLADRTGERSRVLATLAGGASLGYVALSMQDSFAGFLLATAALAVFSTALIPTGVSVSFALLHDTTGRAFGRVRVCGTLGFAAAVASVPWLLDGVRSSRDPAPHLPVGVTGVGAEPGLELIFWFAAALLLCVVPLALLLPRADAAAVRADRGEWRQLLRRGPFVRVLGITLLAYLFIQGPMTLFPILVRAHGVGIDAISGMWMLMLLLEVPLVFAFGASVERAGPRGTIAIGLVAAGVRWIVSGAVDDLAIVTAVQVLHGVTVWGLVLGIPKYVDSVVPERLRSTGQGLLAMIGISAGSILSNLGAGFLIDRLDPFAPAWIGGIGALALAVALPFVLPAAQAAKATEAPHGQVTADER